MHKKDLLVRQFEEMGKVLALLLTFKKNNDWDHFEAELKTAFARFTELEVKEVEEMELEDFNLKIMHSTTLNFERKKILAMLLYEKLDYYMAMNDEGRYKELKNKCLALYQYLANDLTENEYDLDIHYKLKALQGPE